MPKPVVIESPYAGATILERRQNELYAQRALDDSLARDEAPFASHLLYPQVLDDAVPRERRQGIEGQLAWIDLAQAIVVYVDRGFSPGMVAAIKHCAREGYEIVLRTLDGALAAWVDERLDEVLSVRELFATVPLEGPADRSRFLNMEAFPAAPARQAAQEPQEAADTRLPDRNIAPPPFAPPQPQARPDGPASGWDAGPPR